MLNKVQTFIRRQQLLDKSQRYLIAVSGGADSVALLRVLVMLDYQVEVCHCNFMLRGGESLRDEQFVRDLCQQLDVPFHLIHFDTRSYAELHHMSIEMAARELRYNYFEQLCHDLNIPAVCVAHHRDDLIETMLLNMLRGTGIHGMVGIRPSRPIHPVISSLRPATTSPVLVLRPLLSVSRADIEAWLQQLGQTFVTDSTNLVADVQRNKLRLNILPLLHDITPAAFENLYETALLMTEAERVYNASLQSGKARLIKDNTLSINDLKSEPSPLSLLFEWLSDYGFSPATIRQLSDHLDAPSGRVWSSATHDVCIDRKQLIVTEHQEALQPFRIPEHGLYHIYDQVKIRVTVSNDCSIDRSPLTACLDAEKVTFPLFLRPVRQSDRFIPFGMKGSKLLSDFMTDRKLSLPEKRRQLVLTDAHDQILWVVGHRIAQPYAITPHTTQTLRVNILSDQSYFSGTIFGATNF